MAIPLEFHYDFLASLVFTDPDEAIFTLKAKEAFELIAARFPLTYF